MVPLPWDHNAYYHHLLLREVPVGTDRVLDVGCGAGGLASELARRAGHVVALDRDQTMIDIARGHVPDNVTCVLADLWDYPLLDGSFDAIVSMAALHHLPLPRALRHLATALRPGGALAVVALPRRDLPRELPMELVATSWHHLLGFGLAVSAATGDGIGSRLRHGPAHAHMPAQHADLTTSQVREQASAVLPGVRVRRLLLWRYLLTWRRPMG